MLPLCSPSWGTTVNSPSTSSSLGWTNQDHLPYFNIWNYRPQRKTLKYSVTFKILLAMFSGEDSILDHISAGRGKVKIQSPWPNTSTTVLCLHFKSGHFFRVKPVSIICRRICRRALILHSLLTSALALNNWVLGGTGCCNGMRHYLSKQTYWKGIWREQKSSKILLLLCRIHPFPTLQILSVFSEGIMHTSLAHDCHFIL